MLRCSQSGQCGANVRVGEVVALEEQLLVVNLCQRVGHAVPEIQSRWVPAAAAVVSIGLTRDERLLRREGMNLNVEVGEKPVKEPGRRWIAAGVDDDPSLEVRA